nr:PH19-43 [Vibrio phage 1]
MVVNQSLLIPNRFTKRLQTLQAVSLLRVASTTF